MTLYLTSILTFYFIIPTNTYILSQAINNLRFFKYIIHEHISNWVLIFLSTLINWVETDLYLSICWGIFIIAMSFSVRNRFGFDVSTSHYHMFSFAMLYFTFIYRNIHTKPRLKFFKIKILIVYLLTLKRLGPLIYYAWPWSPFLINFYDIVEWCVFLSNDFQFIR